MDIIQILLPQMANFCYIIGDPETGEAAVIDPAFEPERILKEAENAGYRIAWVINTHGHADHTNANAEIIAATGATLCVHAREAKGICALLNRAFARIQGGKGSPGPDRLLEDGGTIMVGKIPVKVIHTPGHTPGCICLLADGNLFTGDTLFVGSRGRTDLPGGSTAQILASIREKLFTLPGDTVVWPGHDYGETPNSTIEREIKTNPLAG